MQEPIDRASFLSSFSKSHSARTVIEELGKLRSMKILVIGEAIIDEYHYTTPMGKSSKEPLVVHRYAREESYAGGALATVNHTAALSDNVTLVTLLGKSPSCEPFIRTHLKKSIKPKFFFREGSTIIKRRYIDQYANQKLFQVSFIWDDFISPTLEKTIAVYLKRELPKYDLIMVNDFGHGFLTPKLIRLITRKAKLLAINVQANSANYGFNIITKYPRADIATTDIHEIRLATHDRYSDVLRLAKMVARHLHTQTLIVTRGAHGSTGYNKEKGFVDVPAFTDTIVDRVGAGDALYSVIAPCLAMGMDLSTALFVGNAAAAIKIQTVGNKTPITFDDLTRFISKLLR
ncbi:MAG: bifunctional ADP-heptose synthase [Candidatus Gottesmanbacteria bacterium]|nr:bifunctional ADP-heptose synthase [Candidatus Gottesmanbacteria bacterium]